MPVEIKVPVMGESVVEATVSRWLKQVGGSVNAGESVVELETDKVNVEVPADSSGVIERIDHKEGASVVVGDVLAAPSTDGKAAPAPPQPPKPGGSTPATERTGNGKQA